MKKIIALGILLTLQSPSFAIQPPVWYQYCDLLYCEAKPMKPVKPSGQLGMMGVLLAPPIFLPWVVIRNQQARKSSENNYWYGRRMDFQAELELCNEPGMDQNMCYLEVRKMESQKSAEHQAHLDSVRLQKQMAIHNQQMRQLRYQLMQQNQHNP